MRSIHRFVAALAAVTLTLAGAAARAGASAWVVAQLAAAPDAAPAARHVAQARPARADAAALAAAAPRLAALGFTLRRTLLDALPPPATRARVAPLPEGFAPGRVVLLQAPAASGAQEATRALVDAGLADWAEPLAVRGIARLSTADVPARPATASVLDSLPDDSLLRDGYQWGLYNVGSAGHGFYGGVARADAHLPEAWRLGVGADDVKIAIADTGIDPAQPELGGLLADGSPRIVDSLNVTFDLVPAVTDFYGHGTPVAGVAAARTNDGPHFSGRGVAGVCGGDGFTTAGCRIVPIKIAPGHSGEATSFDIARAIVHATDVGARAMNLSFAGTTSSRIERLALTYAIVRGCVAVVSAGNKGAGATPAMPMYPAAYAAEGLCIQVGASDPSDARTAWSSYGPGLDLVAPGVNMWTTWMTYPSYQGANYDGYLADSGTSFAAPVVTGAVGLLAAARPELIDTDFQHVLCESADDIGDPGVDAKTGWGRVNIGRALAAVAPRMGIWHDEVAAQSVVPDTTADTLRIGENGPGTLDHWSGWVPARRYAALATVVLPDSFTDSVRVWTRIGGTLAARGDYRLPYFTPTAQVVARTARTFTLRGWLYRADEDSCATCPDPWIPLPPEYARFGFTVLGPVVRDTTRVPETLPPPVRLMAGPNPFRDALTLRAPSAGNITVLDAGGRVVRSFTVPAGETRWDGRDRDGRGVRPGLYFVRWRNGRESRTLRVIKLSP